jgi:hypothetical protein
VYPRSECRHYVAGGDGEAIVSLSIVALVVIIGAFLVGVRRLLPDRLYLFQGMFRYNADLGWPRGVQEEDRARAWVAREEPAWDPEEDELAWEAMVGTSTIVESDRGRPLDPVPIVRVKAEVSRVRLPSQGVDSRGAPR